MHPDVITAVTAAFAEVGNASSLHASGRRARRVVEESRESVAAALGAKLILFLYCLPLRKKSSQVEVLWEDHRNDLFINGFGLLMSAGGSKLKWCKCLGLVCHIFFALPRSSSP